MDLAVDLVEDLGAVVVAVHPVVVVVVEVYGQRISHFSIVNQYDTKIMKHTLLMMNSYQSIIGFIYCCRLLPKQSPLLPSMALATLLLRNF